MIKQVGVTKIVDKTTNKERLFKYTDIPFVNKWIEIDYLPVNFDLVEIWINNKQKKVPAWWDSKKWQGLRLRKGDEITKWKRTEQFE